MKGYRIRREEVFLGKKLRFGEAGDGSFVRLAIRDAGVWKRPVHETWDINGNIGTLKHPLIHYSGRSVTQFVRKLNNYTDQNARYLFTQQVPVSWWHIVAYPAGKFIQNYILKQGFRDGTEGFLHAMFMSMHSFLTRSKLWHLYHPKKH